MEVIAVLIGLGIVGTMFIGAIMGFVANSRITRLERAIKQLQLQLRGQKYEKKGHGAETPDIEFTPSMRPVVSPEPARLAPEKPKPAMAAAVERPKL